MNKGTLGIALAISAWSTTAVAEREVTTFAVSKYAKQHGADYCCYSCDDTPSAPRQAAMFVEGGFSGYDQISVNNDLWVDGRDFADSSQYSWGGDYNDPYGSDFADVIFFSGHGDWRKDSMSSFIVMGDFNSNEDCYPRIADDDPDQRHMEFGNGGAGGEADVFVAFACNTAQWEVYNAGGYTALSAPKGQFNMLNGFHGVLYEVNGINEDVRNYAAAARYDAVGDAWLDYMYDPRTPGASNCPMSIAWGANVAEVEDYFHNAGWFDFHNTGARDWVHRFYICGCDPMSGQRMPSC